MRTSGFTSRWMLSLVLATGLLLTLMTGYQRSSSAADVEIAPKQAPALPLTRRGAPLAERVMIVSVDGLRPDLLLRAATPHMHDLVATGSFTFWARTTAVSITLPSHVSMLTGVTPQRHGIMWNSDLPFKEPVYPNFPTVMELAHKAGLTTAMASGKTKFVDVTRPENLTAVYVPKGQTATDDVVATHAVEIIDKIQPQMMFVHFPGVDVAGHAKGWSSPEQMAAIAQADAALGTVLDALQRNHIRDKTVIILTADHGGAGRGHGPEDPRSRHIPWIINGPGIRKGYDLTINNNLVVVTEDTCATACYLLGISTAKDLDGQPVMQALDRQELLTDAPSGK